MEISSLQNPRVKSTVRLRNRSHRDKTGLFLIEGYRELLRASEANYPIEELYVCPELFLGTNEDALIEALHAKQVYWCEENVFRKLSYRDRPDGLLAVAPQQKRNLTDLKLSDNPFIVVAEAIEKPGNLGTMLRTCDAAGVDALILADPCTDLHNPNVVRASIGTLFTVPVIQASSQEVLSYLKEKEILIVAATPHTDQIYTESDLTKPLALAMGTEQVGLTDLWMNQADFKVKIPMHGHADSLNVAQATSILLFEVLRQR